MRYYNIFVFVATTLIIAGSFVYIFFGQAAEPLQNTYIMRKHLHETTSQSISYKQALATYKEKQRQIKEAMIKEQKRKDSLTALFYKSNTHNFDYSNSYSDDDDDDDGESYYSSGGSIRGRSSRSFRGGSRRGGK